MSTVVPIEQVSSVVTDSSADPGEIERLGRAGVEVAIAVSATQPLLWRAAIDRYRVAPAPGRST